MKIICFDIDNVICKTEGNNYKNSKPDKKAIKIINNLYEEGFYIKILQGIWEDIVVIKKRLRKTKETKNFLKLWSVKYHELIMCKPAYDLFIDDKSYGFSKRWKKF